MARNEREFRLTVVIADVLRFRGMPDMYWSHLPFGEARSERTGARLKRMGTRPGAPDFLLIRNGRCIGLELKEKGGRQSDNQRATESAWTLAGGLYRCCKGYDETVAFLEMVGLLRPDRSVIPAEATE